MSSSSPLVIHHRADFDGLFCRAIAHRYFGQDAEYLGWDYGDPLPQVEPGRRIYMLDISVNGLMDWPDLVWIDHHVTAMQRFPATIPGLRIDGVAACRLAWQWFFHDRRASRDDYIDRRVAEPIGVRLAGEYDVWDKRDPRADLFQHGLRSRDLTEFWPTLLSYGLSAELLVKQLLDAGQALQYAQQRSDASVIQAHGFTIEWEGHCWLALNTVRCNSLTFTAGLRPEHDGCLAFGWNGLTWRVSLYGVPGKPEKDFSGLARRYGGGGHRQACGFTVGELPFCVNHREAAAIASWDEERERALREAARVDRLRRICEDMLSTFRDDGKEVLVTAERQKAWRSELQAVYDAPMAGGAS